MNYVFPPPTASCVAVKRAGLFPVRRIFCVGKNYADHVLEMGGDVKSDPPVFFTKPADAIVASGSIISFAQSTNNLHYEGELVVALKSGGMEISEAKAHEHIFGFAAGCDLTRRDHQAVAKKSGGPWDTAKAFDNSAPIGEISPIESADDLADASLQTLVNGDVRQDALLSTMIWSVPEIIAALSAQFELKAGDLIFTGTPKGVAALSPGDEVMVKIGDLSPMSFSLKAA